jgi:predicted HTH transcriptional regulator
LHPRCTPKRIKRKILSLIIDRVFKDLRYLKRNRSFESKFETDDKRTYTLAILQVHPKVKTRDQAKGQAQKIDLSDAEKTVLAILRKGPCSTEEIVKELGLTKRTGTLQRTLKGLLAKDFIGYLYPETPCHPGQKYVLNIDH